jgi:hypothetical protein
MTSSFSGKRRVLAGLFTDIHRAERAYQFCADRGYEIGQINAVVSEKTRKNSSQMTAKSQLK